MRNLVISMAIGLGLVFSVAVHADEKAEARAAFEEGKELFVAEQYTEAADAFRRANQLNPNWKLLYNIGQSEAAARRYGMALEAFEGYMAGGGDDVPQERQEEVLGEIRRLRDMVGVLEVTGQDGDRLEVNGVARGSLPEGFRLKVGMGQITLRVLRGDDEAYSKSLTISGGETLSVNVDGEEDADNGPGPVEPGKDKKKAIRTAGWISIGVGAGALIGGAVTGGMALSMNGDLTEECGDGDCTVAARQDDVDKRDSLATASTALLVVGGVVAATGIVLLVAGSVGKEDSGAGGSDVSEVALVPALGPGFAGAAISGRF